MPGKSTFITSAFSCLYRPCRLKEIGFIKRHSPRKWGMLPKLTAYKKSTNDLFNRNNIGCYFPHFFIVFTIMLTRRFVGVGKFCHIPAWPQRLYCYFSLFVAV